MSNKGDQAQEHLPLTAERPENAEFLQFNTTRGKYQPVAITQVVTGAIQMYGASSPPGGYVLCDGTSYDKTDATYAAIYAIIGYTFGGSGDNFNVPDMRSRSPIGLGTGAGLSARALAATGGVETHQLSTAELSVHSHGVTDGGHSHTASQSSHSHTTSSDSHNHGVTDSGHTHAISKTKYNTDNEHQHNSQGTYLAEAADDSIGVGTASATDSATTGVTVDNAAAAIVVDSAEPTVTVDSGTTGLTIDNAGSGTAHQTMHPFLGINFIIKL